MKGNNIRVTLNVSENGSDKSLDLPVVYASVGKNAIDISRVAKDANMFTFDPGYVATASCRSSITYIDGENGVLSHRGYAIEDLATNSTFIDVAYLLLYGRLPSASESRLFWLDLYRHMDVEMGDIESIFSGFDSDAHPMGIIMAAMSYFATKYHNIHHTGDVKKIDNLCLAAIAKLPVIAAMAYRYKMNLDFIAPRPEYDFLTNFMYMMFGRDPIANPKTRSIKRMALDKLLILHADHEQNASTSVVRSIASTGADIFASVCGGIAALWGPLHGGANEEVINMLHDIGDVRNIEKYLSDVKLGKMRLMGFGHRVYKNYDPRAAVIKEYTHTILNECVAHDDDLLLDIATSIEKIALNDRYFIDRKLFPNVDFYSGITYRALGIPTIMFTPLFAVARIVGWVSQWKEMITADDTKISRPRQVYIGDTNKKIRK